MTVQNEDYEYKVIKRPKLDDFLLQLVDMYDLAIFTYSIKPYADQIIQQIDQHKIIKYRFYREHCVRHRIDDSKFVIIKDLTRVGVPLDKVLLVDNSVAAGLWQPNNIFMVNSFLGDRNDREFDRILPSLKKLARVPSIYQELERWNQM